MCNHVDEGNIQILRGIQIPGLPHFCWLSHFSEYSVGIPLLTRPPGSAARCSRLSSSLVVVGRWRRNHDVVSVVLVEDEGVIATVILFSSSRGLSHTPTAPKGGETSAGISKFVRVLGVSGSTGLGYPRTDLARVDRHSESPFFFLSSSSSFRRASLREPQQQCSVVVQSRECAMDVAEIGRAHV